MSVLAVHSVVAVSLNAGMLMADVCMVAKAGQGMAGQGRAGQGRAGRTMTAWPDTSPKVLSALAGQAKAAQSR